MRWFALLCIVMGPLWGLPSAAQSEEVPAEDMPTEEVPAEEAPVVADAEENDRSSGSYIGIGGNIGLSGGQTALSEGAFSLVNNTQILEYLSIRSSTVFGDDITSAIALTGGYAISNGQGRTVATPFVGGDISIAGDVAPLISAGVDVPLGEDFTLTNRLNVSFGDDETDVGVLVGVGYNFSLFSLF
ncbi:MAG: hypothetical protein AAFQ74_00880 [Cyanobacteria bacterium J06623_4]